MNPWIQHVKAFASKNELSYRDALKHPDVKKGYKSEKKGGATYGDPDSPLPFTMGTAPATSASARPSARRVVRGRVPVPPVVAPLFIHPTARRAVRGRPPPPSPVSPTPSFTEEEKEDLIDRADDFWFMVKDLEDDGDITKAFAKELRKDIKKILGDTKMSISEKHDRLTSILKKVRSLTDGAVPDPHAF